MEINTYKLLFTTKNKILNEIPDNIVYFVDKSFAVLIIMFAENIWLPNHYLVVQAASHIVLDDVCLWLALLMILCLDCMYFYRIYYEPTSLLYYAIILSLLQ